MKKTLIAALASLMLAGALCAAAGLTSIRSGGAFVIIGEGGGPILTNSQLGAATNDFLTRTNF